MKYLYTLYHEGYIYQKRNNELKIISLFSGDYKRQFYLREISKLTKIPLKTLKINYLDNIKTKFYLLQAKINKTIDFIELVV